MRFKIGSITPSAWSVRRVHFVSCHVIFLLESKRMNKYAINYTYLSPLLASKKTYSYSSYSSYLFCFILFSSLYFLSRSLLFCQYPSDFFAMLLLSPANISVCFFTYFSYPIHSQSLQFFFFFFSNHINPGINQRNTGELE